MAMEINFGQPHPANMGSRSQYLGFRKNAEQLKITAPVKYARRGGRLDRRMDAQNQIDWGRWGKFICPGTFIDRIPCYKQQV